MPARTDRDHKTAKELFLEQATAYFDDLNAAADHAPYGQVFNHAKAFCVSQGRELIRISLEKLMQDRINTLGKKRDQHVVRNAKQEKGIADTETKTSIPPSEP